MALASHGIPAAVQANVHVSCRRIMQAFLTALDLDYQTIYTCERCTEADMTVVIDGKEMGIRHTHFKSYQRPVAEGAAEVPVEW